MHTHAGTLPADPVNRIVTGTSLEFDTDVPPIAVLAQTEVLGNLPNLLLVFTWRLVRSSTPPGTTSRPSSATLVTTTPTSTLIGVLGPLLLDLSWLGVFFKLLPGGWNKVDI